MSGAIPLTGEPPAVGRLDEITHRVLAPNPSPMTLDGTNTYLLGRDGAGEVVVVDPGPRLDAHRAAIDAQVARLDAQVAAVIVTHHHVDHAEAAGWASDWGATLHAFDPSAVPGAEPLPDGATVERGGVGLVALHMPGHTADHVCLRVAESGVVLAGDHVMGRGTSVISWPDGDLVAYLSSLERLRATGAARLDPGHGPSLHHPDELIAGYLSHREERERQVLAALEKGARTPAEVVRVVYADVDPRLHPVAERSVRAHLAKLVAEGRLLGDDGLDRVELPGQR